VFIRSTILFLGLCLSSAALAQSDPDRLPALANSPDVYITVDRASVPAPAAVAIMLHGGGGLGGPELDGFKEWAAWLRQRGVASVMVDGFRGRPKSVQTSPDKVDAYASLLRMRAHDVERTVAWLATTGWADRGRVFVFGRSQGGAAALTAAAERGVRVPLLLTYPVCGSVRRQGQRQLSARADPDRRQRQARTGHRLRRVAVPAPCGDLAECLPRLRLAAPQAHGMAGSPYRVQ
jgi:acetyl esterase/lipase